MTLISKPERMLLKSDEGPWGKLYFICSSTNTGKEHFLQKDQLFHIKYTKVVQKTESGLEIVCITYLLLDNAKKILVIHKKKGSRQLKCIL